MMMHNTTQDAPCEVFDALRQSHRDGCHEWAIRFFDTNSRREAWLGCENGEWMLRVLVALYETGKFVSLATVHDAAVAAAKTASMHLFENDEAARSADASRVGEIDDEIDRDDCVPCVDAESVCRYHARSYAMQAMRWALQTNSASTADELKDAVEGASFFSQCAAVLSIPVDYADMDKIADARERAYSIRRREIADAIRANVSIDNITPEGK